MLYISRMLPSSSPPPPFFVYLALLRLFRILIARARRYAIPSAACYATTAVDVMFLLIFFFIVCETTREHVSTVAVCLVLLHFHEKYYIRQTITVSSGTARDKNVFLSIGTKYIC